MRLVFLLGLAIGGILIVIGVTLPQPEAGDFSTETALLGWIRMSIAMGTAVSAVAGVLMGGWVVMRTPIGFASRLIGRSERFALGALAAGVVSASVAFLVRASSAPVAGASAARTAELLMEGRVLALLTGLALVTAGAAYAILTRVAPHRGQYWLHKD